MPPTPLAQIAEGLPRASTPRHIAIAGAGIAGLVAASQLLHAGHRVTILEARQRVGGRVATLREPFTDGLYGEAGAMRVPRSHRLTLAYIERFGLSTSPFTASNPNGYQYLHGERHRISDAAANPARLGFELAEGETGKTAAQLWGEALAPVASLLKQRGEAAWEEIVAQYDRYSLREFLEAANLSEGAIEMCGILLHLEALMNLSCLEVLREELGEYFGDVVAINGGMDLLPRAFLPELAPHIRFGARLTAVEQSGLSVALHYATAATRATLDADFAIITLPFSVLRHVEFLQPLSRAKQRAIRQLHYDAAAKILFQCRRRFWEEDDNIYGGASVTDLPIRAIYYPDHGRETGRGVLLASYTWGDDAQRWGSLAPADRISEALENLARIHPQVSAEFEVGTSKIWHDDEYAGGAFASFEPGHQTLLHNAIIASEGRLHFAGEHASLAHAWIQGAIESGLRAAWEVHSRP